MSLAEYTENPPYIIDTETCGLYGFITLLQYSLGEGEIVLYSPWEEPASKTIELFEMFANHPGGLVFFNAAFDFFHIYKMWCTLKLLAEIDPDALPEDNIDLMIQLEEQARDYPQCLKPVKCLDLFLHARKGSYQSTMDRKDIVIKRVPSKIAWMVAEELEKRIPFKNIYFARRKDKNQPKWQIQELKDDFGDYDPEWKNIIVRFKPSSALKALAVDIGLAQEADVLKFGDISPKMHPVEFGYAPFAKAAIAIKYKDKQKEKKRKHWPYKGTWPDRIKHHIIHWGHNQLARQYAADDITYTRGLLKFFNYPEMGDDDSELACMVGCVRWRGFKIDLDGIRELKKRALAKRQMINDQGYTVDVPTAPNQVKLFIMEVLDETEKLGISSGDTKKVTLENIAKDWNLSCPVCGLSDDGDETWCETCKSKRTVKHPAAIRSQLILDSRKAQKEIELYDKLLAAGRLHASFKVIGTLSSRMSGGDGLNPQAIKKTDDVKGQFILQWPGYILAGGDFDAFEITIAEAVYNDPALRKDLLTCEACKSDMVFNKEKVEYVCSACGSTKGQKIHALFGVCCFPPLTYDEVKATDGTDDDKYTRSKSAIFTKIYGGGAESMIKKLGVTLEAATEACRVFDRKYAGVGRAQERVDEMFGSMSQPDGRGSAISWKEPADRIETLFGFARFFTLENMICKAMYDLATRMPKAMKEVKLKVTRYDRTQDASGAARSAIYGAAFRICSYAKRAAKNHVIQGSGAQITKKVQRRIWDVQPAGAYEWIVQPMNIHDSIMTPIKPEYVKKVAEVVHDTVEEIRPVVPLIKMPWESFLGHWADKGGPICLVDRSSGSILGRYKSRYALKKYGYELTDVHKSLARETINDQNWRIMTKDEIKETAKKDLWTKT